MTPETDLATALSTRQAVLISRLNDGDARIAEARRAGIDTSNWEGFWISLLAEYEMVMDELHSILLDEYASAA